MKKKLTRKEEWNILDSEFFKQNKAAINKLQKISGVVISSGRNLKSIAPKIMEGISKRYAYENYSLFTKLLRKPLK